MKNKKDKDVPEITMSIDLNKNQINYLRDCMATREYEGGGFASGLDWHLLQMVEKIAHLEKIKKMRKNESSNI